MHAVADGGEEEHADDQDEEAAGGCGGHKVVDQSERNSCRQPPGRLMHMGV